MLIGVLVSALSVKLQKYCSFLLFSIAQLIFISSTLKPAYRNNGDSPSLWYSLTYWLFEVRYLQVQTFPWRMSWFWKKVLQIEDEYSDHWAGGKDALCHLLPRAVNDPFWIRHGGREVERCVVNPAWASARVGIEAAHHHLGLAVQYWGLVSCSHR